MNAYIITECATTLACVREEDRSRVSGTIVLSTGLQIDFEVRRGTNGTFYSNVFDHGSFCGEMSDVFFDGQGHVMRQPTPAECEDVLRLLSCADGVAKLNDTLAARVWSAQPTQSVPLPRHMTAARARYLRAAIALSTARLDDPDDLYAALAVSSSLFFKRAYHVLLNRNGGNASVRFA